MVYGYVRVSSKEQNGDRQIIALNGLGIPEEQMYINKQSGKDFNRPKYIVMLDELQM
jgi:DNA invertase Pin-like site-specific DNA recombinase